MEKISNLSQAQALIERLSSASLEQVVELIKDQDLAAQAFIFFSLEQQDLAQEKVDSLMEESGLDYYERILPYLSSNSYELFIKVSGEAYLDLRLHSEESLREVAIGYIAPRLNLSASERAQLLTTLVGEEAQVFFHNQKLQATSLMQSLILELNLDIKIHAPQTEMAIEYAEDPVEVVLHVSGESLAWRLKPQVVREVESFWEGVKNTLVNFSKNTITSPNFRKYAVAGLALGLAISGTDAMASEMVSDIDFDKAKELFGVLDESLNQNFMPKMGFKGCAASVDFAVDTSNHLKAHINLGDKQMVFDMASEVKGNGASSHARDHFQVYIDHLPKPKSGGCNMSKSELFDLAKVIKSKLLAYAGK